MPFGRGNLYHLLSNPIYIGKIRYNEQVYDGEHEPIVTSATFEEVQALLASQALRRRSQSNITQAHLLTGLLFDEVGEKLRPVHANRQGVRYRYYVSKQFVDQRRNGSEGWRLPAPTLESVIEHRLNRMLSDQAQLSDWIRQWAEACEIQLAMRRAEELRSRWASGTADAKRSILQKIVRKITLKPGSLTIELDRRSLSELLLNRTLPPSDGAFSASDRITRRIATPTIALPNTWLRNSSQRDGGPKVRCFRRSLRCLSQVLPTTRR